MYAENEILFPPSVIPRLRYGRGEGWKELVDRVAGLPDDHPESLAFSLMMIEVNGCISCETDCYRAMKGCTACSLQALHRSRASHTTILNLYEACLDRVNRYLAGVYQIDPADAVVGAAQAA